MTIIKAITTKGFKSFAKKTEFIFENGYNTIIGPNGAGKSNVCDALCFVLGKSSAKGLRAEKSANLIFHGGKKGSPGKEAEVSIIFDNTKKDFPIKDKEVKVTRIVRSSGNSIYKLNENTVTRQQVLDTLAQAHIDPDGHNIVLQGDIVKFMEMRPNDRRELIEEVAGIGVFEEKKQKALHELEKVEGKLKEATIIMTEREAYLRELKKERDQAVKYKDLQNSIKDNKETYLHLQIKEKEGKKEEIEKKVKEQEKEQLRIQNGIEEIKQNIQREKDAIKKINEDIEEKGEIEQKKLHQEIDGLKTAIVKDATRLETCKNEIQRIQQRKKSLLENLKDLEEKIKELTEERENLDRRIKLREYEKKKTSEEIYRYKQKHNLQDRERLDEQIDSLQSELESLKEKLQNAVRQKDKVTYQKDNLNLADDKEIKKVEVTRQEFKKVTTDLAKSLSESASVGAQLGKTKGFLQESAEQLARLRARQFTIRERQQEGLASRKILELKDKNIYGTVGNIGKVSAKYALALEVAAGARLKSIIVEDDTTAQKCIQYLKSQRLGVATFLPINKIAQRQVSPQAKASARQKGAHGLAIDIVSYDKKFANIFSYVFGDTVIVDDIATARKIGIGKQRIVTIEGDLMELSGAMIGGYRRKSESAGGFKEKEVDAGLNKLEEETTRLEKVLETLEKRKSEVEDEVYKLKERKAELEGELIRYERTFNIKDIADLKKKKVELQKEDIDLQKEIKDITANLQKNEKELGVLKEKRKAGNPQVMQGLQSLEEKKQKIREEAIRNTSEKENIDTQINDIYLKEVDKTRRIIEENEREMKRFEHESDTLDGVLKENKQLLKEKEAKEKEFYSNFKNLFAKRNKINETMNKREGQAIREGEKIAVIQGRINNLNVERAKLAGELEGIQKEFEEFADW